MQATTEGRPRICFVDDEPAVRKIVRLTLEEQLACRVTCFERAEDCLQALRDDQTSCLLLITDVKMPGMDGLTLLRQVRQVRPFLPILIITGHGDVPMAVEALKAGAVDFVQKPLNETVLVPVVESALKQSLASEWSSKPLTQSETRVLQLIADGRSNREIATELHRSVRTIERHRYQLMHKLNVSTPAGLTKVAMAMGLTSPDVQ